MKNTVFYGHFHWYDERSGEGMLTVDGYNGVYFNHDPMFFTKKDGTYEKFSPQMNDVFLIRQDALESGVVNKRYLMLANDYQDNYWSDQLMREIELFGGPSEVTIKRVLGELK